MNQIGAGNFLYPDNYVKCVGIANIATDCELESAFGRTGVDYRKVGGRMFFKEIAEDKLSLGLAVHGNFAVQVHVDVVIEELDNLFGIARFNGILHGSKDVLGGSNKANTR